MRTYFMDAPLARGWAKNDFQYIHFGAKDRLRTLHVNGAPRGMERGRSDVELSERPIDHLPHMYYITFILQDSRTDSRRAIIQTHSCLASHQRLQCVSGNLLVTRDGSSAADCPCVARKSGAWEICRPTYFFSLLSAVYV